MTHDKGSGRSGNKEGSDCVQPDPSQPAYRLAACVHADVWTGEPCPHTLAHLISPVQGTAHRTHPDPTAPNQDHESIAQRREL